MFIFRQLTSSQPFLLGPFVDTAGAAVTDLTISTATIRISKNGGNMAGKDTGGSTHDENGWYTTTLSSADTNTVGRLQISANNSSALPVWFEGQVLEEAIFDALFAEGANAWSGSTGASRITGLADDVITSSAIADDAITSSGIAADAFLAAAFGDDFITSSSIADGAITSSGIAADAFTSSAVADGFLTSSAFAAGAIDAAAINADAIDLFWNEAQVESTGAPPTTGTMRQYMQWWGALSVNTINQTATGTTVRNRANSANLSTGTVSDDATTFVRGTLST